MPSGLRSVGRPTNRQGKRQKAGSTARMTAFPERGGCGVVSAGRQGVLGRRSRAEERVREWVTASTALTRP